VDVGNVLSGAGEPLTQSEKPKEGENKPTLCNARSVKAGLAQKKKHESVSKTSTVFRPWPSIGLTRKSDTTARRLRLVRRGEER